jgi:hypothetical protein
MNSSIEPTSTPSVARPCTVKGILEHAGGPTKIAEASAGAISVEAVYKWSKIGIPDRHWSILMGLCDVTADELYAANLAARAPADAGQE